jgi:hypothetical protein
MSLQDIVSVTISTTTKTPTRKGFGTPMIAAYHSLNADRVRVYTDLVGIAADGHLPGDPAYLDAAAIFAQSPRPASVKIGRRTNPWTQVVNLTPNSVSTGLVYAITIGSDLCTYTAAGGDNLAAVCTALASAINNAPDLKANATAILATGGASGSGALDYAGAQLNGAIGLGAMNPPRALEMVFSSHANWTGGSATITGTDSNGNTITDTFTISAGGGNTATGTGKRFATVTNVHTPAQGGTAGTFTVGVRARVTADGSSGTKVVVTTTLTAPEKVSYQHDSVHSNLTLQNATADAGIATDLAAIYLADPDFYGFVLDSNGAAEIEAAAAWAESTGGLMFVAQTCDTAVSDTASSSDTASVAWYLKVHSFFRTHLEFHPTIGLDAIAAAMLGSRLPADPGSDTWAFKTLASVSSYVLTATQQANLAAKNVGYYITIAGVDVTQGGKVSGGEWCDVIRFRDWLVARLQEGIFGLLVNNAKVPYTDAGIDLVKGRVKSVLGDGIRAGGLASSPAPTITAPAAADIDPATRASRVLPNVNFGAQLAGAIHAVQINGLVTS